MTDTAAPAPAAPAGNPRARRRGFLILGIIVLVAAIVWAVFHFLLSAPEEETDNAYVAGDVVAITARDPGTVLAIHADNTQTVRAGQPLIELDPATADVALASAEADLARAVRATRSSFSAVDEAGAAVVQAEAQLAEARGDYQRRRGADAAGAVSGEELAHAADQLRVAAANLRLARSRQTQSRTTVQGTTVETNPQVMAAVAAYRRAAITRSHMQVAAPVGGVVAQRTVQLGQQVAAGTPLMSVVPLDRLWIDANFRETQLRDLRIGQPATIIADTYGDDVVFHGRVVGVGAGSGNAFALLPAQNASGNWIKITQRLPVRIMLDPRELRANPLRVGLSATVTVDTADRSGPRLGQPGRAAAASLTTAAVDPATDARIRQIIAANR
ncbi:membrane fusion protein (multidrug efflux system) [Sphingomonas jejuensis]|uniref:Membrane fusion protein (Multidrug efflux system) n=1 Tax=Sphingomonas jejuensis TaxID=904715 RepID=A0ABX0XH93_9SPHN|nr:HlyD family efflux transporter periplasmic adaptor subunit [Sphingomonas jejuensis]NJC32696.1 membrane fusion protein (multidrug efflux system) [Sphingomonas jejuensis]